MFAYTLRFIAYTLLPELRSLDTTIFNTPPPKKKKPT